MAQFIADSRDIEFVLYEQFNIEQITMHDKFDAFNRKAFDLIINEARKLAIKEILPTLTEGDREGVLFENGQVKVPACYQHPFKLLREGGWTAMTAEPDLGGQGLPFCVALAAKEYLIGANSALALYANVGHAVGDMIEAYGTETQKRLFLKNLYTGHWSGTMQLTEPQAGSDVGALTTSAVKTADGTYLISGNKIFITSGDQDLTENIIHPVLARIEGAPPGTKGISLFLVPKYWVNGDGSLAERNDIFCDGVLEKLGLHGSATCSMNLGVNGKCRGLLLGEENKGMRIMFHLVNTARLWIGALSFACGSSAYMHALKYARERLQGKDLEKIFEIDAPQVPIIRHPDVRRMLMWMKAHVEGMRSLCYFVGRAFDSIAVASEQTVKDYYQGLIDLLTPVVKSYCADRGYEICVEAMQVYGGYGYTRDYPIEQLVRDSKVASIYEGTNGIQAMDLLGRKLGMQQGAVFLNLLGEMRKTARDAKEISLLQDQAIRLESAIDLLEEVAVGLGKVAFSPKVKMAFAYAKPFLDGVGDMCMAWMHLWRAVAAAPRLAAMAGSSDPAARLTAAAESSKAAFYEGVLQTAKYYIYALLPITAGKLNAIKDGDSAIVDIPEASFGG